MSDAVAYARLRDSADRAVALTIEAQRVGALSTETARADILALRSSMLTVDGFDRVAIDRLNATIDERIADLEGSTE